MVRSMLARRETRCYPRRMRFARRSPVRAWFFLDAPKPAVLAGLVLFLSAAACSSSTSPGSSFGDVDAATADAMAADGGFACPEPLTPETCPGCRPFDFPSAFTAWCDRHDSSFSAPRCGRFDVLSDYGVDEGNSSYFDHTTGALVALLRVGVLSGCIYGPPEFQPPDCPPDASVTACPAPTDGSVRDAGPADGAAEGG